MKRSLIACSAFLAFSFCPADYSFSQGSLDSGIDASYSQGAELMNSKSYMTANKVFELGLKSINKNKANVPDSLLIRLVVGYDLSFHKSVEAKIIGNLDDALSLAVDVKSINEFDSKRKSLLKPLESRLGSIAEYSEVEKYNAGVLHNYLTLVDVMQAKAPSASVGISSENMMYYGIFSHIQLYLKQGLKQSQSIDYVFPLLSVARNYPKPEPGWKLNYVRMIQGVCLAYQFIFSEYEQRKSLSDYEFAASFEVFHAAIAKTLDEIESPGFRRFVESVRWDLSATLLLAYYMQQRHGLSPASVPDFVEDKG
jgi:hypothetical protein